MKRSNACIVLVLSILVEFLCAGALPSMQNGQTIRTLQEISPCAGWRINPEGSPLLRETMNLPEYMARAGIRRSFLLFQLEHATRRMSRLTDSGSMHCFAVDVPTMKPPGREVCLPREEARDSFFAYVLGIVYSGTNVDVDNKQMREILNEFRSSANLPFDLVTRARQSTDSSSRVRTIGLEFQHDINIQVPFSLLFYHPGSIVSSQMLSFSVTHLTPEVALPPYVSSPVFVLTLTNGSVLMTINGWLKALMAAYQFEDTWLRHVVFFKWRGDQIGLFEGVGRETGREHRAYFNFTSNAMVFPEPDDLDVVGSGFELSSVDLAP